MVIKNIIKSETEPSTNCLWLKDNSLYHHNNGNWEPVDLNTVQGVEKLEEDVSEIQSSVQKIERDYIGVWDELNSVKEILASIQSGELPALLARLGYTKEDIDNFVEANLNMQLGITLEDVKRSVELWENRDYFIHSKLMSNQGSATNKLQDALLSQRVLPSWTDELAENGLYHKYTSDLGTTEQRIYTEDFFSMFSKTNEKGVYIPYVCLKSNGSLSSYNSINIAFANKIYIPADNPVDKNVFNIRHLRGVNSLIMESSSTSRPLNTGLYSTFSRLKTLTIENCTNLFDASSLFRNHDSFINTPVININTDKVYNINGMFEGSPDKFPALSGTFDFSEVHDTALSLDHSIPPLRDVFNFNVLSNSTIYYKSSDLKFSYNGTYTRGITENFFRFMLFNGNNNIFIDYQHDDNAAAIPPFTEIIGSPGSTASDNPYKYVNNNINIFNLERLFIDESTPVYGTILNANLIVPQLKYLSTLGMAERNIWLRNILAIETDIELDKLIADEYFSEERFVDCISTWGALLTPVNVIMSSSKYNKLSDITKASLADKNFNIVVNE